MTKREYDTFWTWKRALSMCTVAALAVLAAVLVPEGSLAAQAKPVHCKKGFHRNGRHCVANHHKRPRRYVGPQGVPGPAGPQGSPGVDGQAGAQGPPGTPAPVAPKFDPSWGVLSRLESGSPTAVLGYHSPESPRVGADGALILATADGAEKAAYATTEFEGLPIASIAGISFEEFVTASDFAISPRNEPNIQIEVNPNIAGQTYSPLVFAPPPATVVDGWSTVSALTGTAGFAGWYFSNAAVATATNCSQAHECTLDEVQAAAPLATVSLSLGIGKGLDFQFQGAVDNLTIGYVNGGFSDFDFTAPGVIAK